MLVDTLYERSMFQEVVAALSAGDRTIVSFQVYGQTLLLILKWENIILTLLWFTPLMFKFACLLNGSFTLNLPDAQIYSQLSKLDKSSTSSRAAFLFGATVNSGQNKRSQIAVNIECARGIEG